MRGATVLAVMARSQCVVYLLFALKKGCVKRLPRLSNEECIIANLSKKCNIPLTRADHIRKYRQKHSAVRHDYAALATEHTGLDRCMLNFTARGRGRGAYTKLRLINEIKSYVTYLIANSKSNIYFFSNIEIGTELSNPHLHTQIWCEDLEAVRAIYDKVITKFSLVKKRCKLTEPDGEPQQQPKYYNYVIKDYAASLTDDQVWNLEQTKMRMRNHTYINENGLRTKLNVRFISKSKGKYTQKMYRMAYRAFRVVRALADGFLDLVTSTLFFKKEVIEDLLYSKKFIKSFSISSFISIREQGVLENGLSLDLNFFCSFLLFLFGIEVLFYSPARGPPFS